MNPEEETTEQSLDPKNFIGQFTASSQVQHNIENLWVTSKAKDETITRDEAAEAFLRKSLAKDLLWAYYVTLKKQNNNRPLRFRSDHLSLQFQTKRDHYYTFVRKMENKMKLMVYHGDNPALQSDEVERSTLHSAAARQLVEEGIVPSYIIGKTLLQFMSIGDGVEPYKYDPDREERKRQMIKKSGY